MPAWARSRFDWGAVQPEAAPSTRAVRLWTNG
jgi:hypothetical protein